MQTELDILLKAVDEASAVLSGAADKIRGSMGNVENASNKVTDAQKKTDSSTKDLVTGFSGMATGAFALYMTIDRVEKSQFALEKANLAVKRSNESVEAAQNKYNAAVLEFGVNSAQAKDASDKLSIAQDAFALANDRAGLAQGNVNQAMMQGALTIIPTLITIGSSASKALDGMTKAQDGLNTSMLANPIFLVIAAIAALIAILVIAYYTIEPFRNAVDNLGRFLGLLPPAMTDAEREAERMANVMAFAAEQTRQVTERYNETIRVQDNFRNSMLDLGREVTGTDEILSRSCTTLEDYRGLSSDASGAVEVLQGRMKALASDCEATNRVLENQISNLGAGSAAVTFMGRDTDRLTKQELECGSQIGELNRKIAENTDLTKEQVDSIKKQIDELLRVAQRAEDTADLMENLSDSYGKLRAAADASLPLIARQFDEAFKSGRIEDATNIVVAFADKLGVSFEDAQKVFDDFVSDMDKGAQRVTDFTVKMKQDYENTRASADANLKAISQSVQDCFSQGRFDDAFKVVQGFADKYGITWEQALSDIQNFTDEQKKAIDAAKGALKDFGDSLIYDYDMMKAKADSSLESLHNSFMRAFNAGDFARAQDLVTAFAAKYGVSLDDARQVIESWTAAVETSTETVVASAETVISEFDKFRDKVTGQFELVQASADKNLAGIAGRFNSAFDKGMFDVAALVVQSFANKYGISFDQAEQIINNFTDAQEKAFEKQVEDTRKAAEEQQKALDALNKAFMDHADKIKSDYFDRVTSQSDAFKDRVDVLAGSMVASWNRMGGATLGQSLNMTLAIQNFADQWGLSWDEAHAIVTKAADDIDAEMKRVPESIESQLIGKAQADFQAFKDCVTGKSRTLNTDVTGQIDNLTSNITELISKGLVGEAQAEMQAYVDCNTNKTATMVEDINGMMEKLTENHNAQIEAMRATADTLTGAERLAVLRQIDEMVTAYNGKMQQLRDWQSQLLGTMVTDADRAAAAIQAAMAQAQAQAAAVLAGQAATKAALGIEKPLVAIDQAALAVQKADLVASKVSTQIALAMPERSVAAPAVGVKDTLMRAIGESAKPTVSIQIMAPLVQVQGSADRATADLAAVLVQEGLRNVIVEASSSGAPATSKTIRVGNRVAI